MANAKLKYLMFFLGIVMVPNAMSAVETSFLAGLDLEDPLVRLSPEDYMQARGGANCKLVIGAGHIHDVNALHPEYRPDGGNALTESIQVSGSYDFHRHEGWYAFSAETDAAFGSDMAGNIRKPSHQDRVFPENSWDLIWDESYHPDVLSAKFLFEKAWRSLKQDGAFVFTLPITQQGGGWITGHNCEEQGSGRFNEVLAYSNLSRKFSSLAEVKEFIRENLYAIGFSSVELHESSLTKVLNQEFKDSDFLSQEKRDDLPQVLEEIRSLAGAKAVDVHQNPLLAIDPIFAHTGGHYYVVARK
jgi:hypothetical protein